MGAVQDEQGHCRGREVGMTVKEIVELLLKMDTEHDRLLALELIRGLDGKGVPYVPAPYIWPLQPWVPYIPSVQPWTITFTSSSTQ